MSTIAPGRTAARSSQPVVADIRRRVANLDIAITTDRKAANVEVRLIRERDFGRTLRKAYGRDRARQIPESLEPQCLSGFRKDAEFRIVHSDVFLVVDAGRLHLLRLRLRGAAAVARADQRHRRCHGPCSTMTCRWDSSASTTSTFSTSCIIRACAPGMTRRGGARAPARDHARGARVRGEGERTGRR